MLRGELFATDMVRAYQEGRKLHTARPIVPQPVCHGPNITFKPHSDDFFLSAEKGWLRCRTCGHDPEYSREGVDVAHHYKPKHRPGDYIYCRETWTNYWYPDTDLFYAYKADGDFAIPQGALWGNPMGNAFIWRPSIHMPREAARLFLRDTDTTVMRLEDVDEQFALEDGFTDHDGNSALVWFHVFWQAVYGDARWMWVYWTEPCSREEAMDNGLE